MGVCANLQMKTSDGEAGSFGQSAAMWGIGTMMAVYIAGGISGAHCKLTLLYLQKHAHCIQAIPWSRSTFLFSEASPPVKLLYTSAPRSLELFVPSGLLTESITMLSWSVDQDQEGDNADCSLCRTSTQRRRQRAKAAAQRSSRCRRRSPRPRPHSGPISPRLLS